MFSTRVKSSLISALFVHRRQCTGLTTESDVSRRMFDLTRPCQEHNQ
jgi:hypothetical protein